MAQSRFGGDVKNLSKGFITEASPLNFPEGASLDELNIELERTGERVRRKGFDFELGFNHIDTDVPNLNDIAFSSFLWKSPGGMSEAYISVVQVGGNIYFFDGAVSPLSENRIFEYKISASNNIVFDMSSVDGMLVIASNSADIVVIKVDDLDSNSFSVESNRLKIRDLFGLEDIVDGVDLREGDGVDKRPSSLSYNHIYNLRNQTFAYPRLSGNTESVRDTISYFQENSGGKFPSNSDNVVPFFMADANDADDRNSKRYFAKDSVNSPLGTTGAPKGYFIIDLLRRGASRLEALKSLHKEHTQLAYPISSLNADYTPDGATCLTTYAGRIFYGGFSDKLTDGDSYSPHLGGYVLFSKLVKSPQDIFACYQSGDPTSTETPDLIDTDGGFIKIDGAANILQMVPIQTSLFIFAGNGVWMVDGGNNYGFTATNYKVNKLSDVGCVSKESIVNIEGGLLYWGEGGIYRVSQNQYGDWGVENITDQSIATWYQNISDAQKRVAKGFYEPYTKQVRWLVNNALEFSGNVQELIFDIALGAFTKFEIFTPERDENNALKVVSFVEVAPFTLDNNMYYVIDIEGNNVIDSEGNFVIVYKKEKSNAKTGEVNTRNYLVVSKIREDSSISFSFGNYINSSFRDFYSFDNKGVDASGYMLTGYVYNEDLQRHKQLPYLTVYTRRTETGFDEKWKPQNLGSVLMTVMWEWTDSVKSNKWSKEVQVYRHRRMFYPDSKEAFDDGHPVVITKNKVRGRGRTLSILFKTEEFKDFKLLGYSLWGAMNQSI